MMDVEPTAGESTPECECPVNITSLVGTGNEGLPGPSPTQVDAWDLKNIEKAAV